MPIRSIDRFVLGAVAFLAMAADAHALGVPADGKALAERVCATCHVVAPDQKAGNADVPSFSAVARKYQDKPDTLRAFLTEPHRPMPDLSLTRQEIENLVAYIRGL